MKKKMFKNEIAIRNKEAAMRVVSCLVEEEYCIMLSREEDLYIIDFEYSEYSDRNNVIFMSREDFEQKFEEIK
jgi:hypothetical protein